MSTTTSTHIQLASRPTGWPSQDNFTTVTVTYPDLGPGQIRVRNDYMSVDPYMRGRLNEGRSYIPPFQIGDTSPVVPSAPSLTATHPTIPWEQQSSTSTGGVTSPKTTPPTSGSSPNFHTFQAPFTSGCSA